MLLMECLPHVHLIISRDKAGDEQTEKDGQEEEKQCGFPHFKASLKLKKEF